MIVLKKTQEVSKFRSDSDGSWGIIPTMGFLHEGHISLVEKARQDNDFVGVSIFVNPVQFNNDADLAAYPRNFEADLSKLKTANVDVVWAPSVEKMYPSGFQTEVRVNKMTSLLEGKARPGHFDGVTTVVAKIFNTFQPTRAYFGEKDAQQWRVIKRMIADLNFNLELIVCPTVREQDGLALSSRNARLSPIARQNAVCLYRALQSGAKACRAGEPKVEKLKEIMQNEIDLFGLTQTDYISIADPDTLQELTIVQEEALLSLAVFVEGVRLIDNLTISACAGQKKN